MRERDIEMHEQNDPAEHAEGEVDAWLRDEAGRPGARDARSPSPTEPEMRRDQFLDSS